VRPLGVLGGTFDPVHNAHLELARTALAALDLERVLWIPTGAPRYREPPVAAAPHRVAMLELAIGGEPRYAIDERELAPGGSGYSYDMLASLRSELTGISLVLLMGADQYSKIETWHRWRELPRLCRIAVFARPGWPEPPASVTRVSMPPLAVSGSEIRACIARGDDVSAMLPPAVLDYIQTHHLYGHP